MTLTQINKAGLDEIALDHVFTIGASGSSAYTFQGEGLNGTVNNPTLYLTRGKTYRFENGSGGHPIRIQSTSGASGTAYNTGVTNNAGSGTVIVEVQHDAPDVLYYQCTSHAAMNGILYITGALADGGVTTAKLADDAVNNDKLANSVVASIAANTAKTSNATHTGDVTGSTSLTIANNAVTTAKIADEAVTLAKLPHGTSSNDGKFLRANNGADPTFETVSGTTINNNADNRVITGSGTANTLEGEANLTFDGDNLLIKSSTDGRKISFASDGTSHYMKYDNTLSGIILNGYGGIGFETNGTNERLRIDSSGNVGIGLTNPSSFYSSQLVVKAPSEGGITIRNTNSNDWNYIMFASGDSGNARYDSYIGVDHGNNKVRISTNESSSAKNVELRSDGNFHISDGNVVFASGHGIDFSATNNSGNNASMSNELFDDYEEGTWTPFFYAWIGGGSPATHDTQIGRYTKVGNLVHITYDLKGDRGNMAHNYITVGGLPFTYASSNRGWAAIPWTEYVGSENSTSATRGHGLQFGGGATAHAWLTGYTNTSNYLPVYLSTSYMSNGSHTRLRGSATYFTNQ